MAAFSHKSADDNYLLSAGHNCGMSDTCLPSRVPKLTFIPVPSVDFYTTTPLTVSASSYSLEGQYIYPGTNTVDPRKTDEYSLDYREIDEDIHRLFTETNVSAIDELYNNNIPQNVSVIFDEAIATTDSKEVVEHRTRKKNQVEYRPCRINSRMDKATSIKTCRGSAASTKERSYKGKQITESASKQLATSEPAKDFVLVRARRGQATDRHSIAERLRREKIRKRMDYLQDLVPGCCKGTGKTVILDEIINYIKSLQNQVEFLSMKLSAASSRYDFSLEPGNHNLGYTVACPAHEYGGGTVQGSTPNELFHTVFKPSTDAACFAFAKENTGGFTGADECDHQLQSVVHGRLREQDRNHGMAHDLCFREHH